jgi:hypothetical protein
MGRPRQLVEEMPIAVQGDDELEQARSTVCSMAR